MKPAWLLSLCAKKIDELIAQFDAAPATHLLLDLAAVCELIVTFPTNRGLSRVAVPLRRAALGWLRSGLIEAILLTRAEHTYHMALLLRLATADDDYTAEDISHLAYLCANGACVRSEMPLLTLRTATAHLAACMAPVRASAAADLHEAKACDKRVLRSRNDEQDIQTISMILQLHALKHVDDSWIPQIMPQTMLYNALQQRDIGPLAVLALFHQHGVTAPAGLLKSARQLLLQDLVTRNDLLPAGDGQTDAPYALLGLQLRNSLACCALFDGE